MSHDAFISHSSEDKVIADAVTASLEQAGVRCWIAPRDIRPGDSWGGAIVEAIETCRVMVVIFSAKSNDSKQVMREVERAVQNDVVVVPFRIEDVKPSKDMEYFLSATHWLDAMTPEMGGHLEELTKTVSNIIEKPVDEKATAKASKKAAALIGKVQAAKPAKGSKLSSMLGVVMAVLVLALAALFFMGGDDSDDTAATPTKAKDLKPRESGDIKLQFEDEVRAGGELEINWRGKTAGDDSIVIVAADAAAGVRTGRKALKTEESLVFEVSDKPGDYEVRFIDAASGKIIAREDLEITKPKVTLDAPDEGLAGTVISVKWSGPNDKYDQLAIAKPGAPGKETVSYAAIAKGSPTDVRLPDVAGKHVLRYVSGGGREVWHEQSLSVEQPEISFDIPSTLPAGAEVMIDWKGPANKGDYVTVAEPDMAGNKYVSYAYAKAGKQAKLRMPATGGKFQIRYISGQKATIWASKPVSIKMPTVSLETPDRGATGDTLLMDWQGPANKGDYVTVAMPNTAGNKYISYKYIKEGGKAEIQLPEEPGNYVIRYVSAVKGTVWFEEPVRVTRRAEQISADEEVTAGKQFKVKWQNNGFAGQYIGIYPAGSADDAGYTTYVYTKNKTDAKLRAPKEAGKYELRYMSGGKKEVWARTALKVVAGE